MINTLLQHLSNFFLESSESSSVKDAAQSNSEQSPEGEDTENWSPDTEPENDIEDMFRIEEDDELDDDEDGEEYDGDEYESWYVYIIYCINTGD